MSRRGWDEWAGTLRRNVQTGSYGGCTKLGRGYHSRRRTGWRRWGVRRLILLAVTFLVLLGCLEVALGHSVYAAGVRGLYLQNPEMKAGVRGLYLQNPEMPEMPEMKETDLQQFYQEINRASFDGKLPVVPVRWGNLTEDDAYGITHFKSGVPYAMELDRQS